MASQKYRQFQIHKVSYSHAIKCIQPAEELGQVIIRRRILYWICENQLILLMFPAQISGPGYDGYVNKWQVCYRRFVVHFPDKKLKFKPMDLLGRPVFVPEVPRSRAPAFRAPPHQVIS